MKKQEFKKQKKNTIFSKVKDFFKDEYGGNLIEYALLIGLALFIFFIIVGVMTSLLDWPLDLADNFWDDFGAIFKIKIFKT
ncbi:MAG: Flp family type IVb pilin [Promethearchaeota archaeon]